VQTWGVSATPASTSAPDAGDASADATPQDDARALDASTSGVADAAEAGPLPRHRRVLAMSNAAREPADGGDDAGDAGASGPSEVGLSFGIRGGYMLPFGMANGTPLYGTVLLGAVPVGVDAGWFFSRHFYAGLYFVYGFGVGAGQNNDTCSEIDTDCNATLYRFGAVAHYHLNPGATWDPWVGAGLGYEVVTLVATSDVDESTVEASSLQALDLTVELGLDLKPLPYLGIGPYMELATGPYIGTESFAMHGWFTFGARFRTNL
jgi:hypothetical protein